MTYLAELFSGASHLLLYLWKAKRLHATMSKLPPKAFGKPTSGCIRQKPNTPANVSQNTVIDKQAKGNLIPMRFRPYEERMQNYLEVRNRIFQDKDPQINRRTNILKAYYAKVKRNKKNADFDYF